MPPPRAITALLHGEKFATIRAKDVTTTDVIDRVRAMITPPGYDSDPPSRPISDLPAIELGKGAEGRYQGTYKRFSTTGTYSITVYATDMKGRMSLPKTTQVVQSNSRTPRHSQR